MCQTKHEAKSFSLDITWTGSNIESPVVARSFPNLQLRNLIASTFHIMLRYWFLAYIHAVVIFILSAHSQLQTGALCLLNVKWLLTVYALVVFVSSFTLLYSLMSTELLQGDQAAPLYHPIISSLSKYHFPEVKSPALSSPFSVKTFESPCTYTRGNALSLLSTHVSYQTGKLDDLKCTMWNSFCFGVLQLWTPLYEKPQL